MSFEEDQSKCPYFAGEIMQPGPHNVTNARTQTHTHTCLVDSPVIQAGERRKGVPSESNGFGNHGNLGNLPDLLQQSNSPSATPTTTLHELGDMSEVRPAP